MCANHLVTLQLNGIHQRLTSNNCNSCRDFFLSNRAPPVKILKASMTLRREHKPLRRRSFWGGAGAAQAKERGGSHRHNADGSPHSFRVHDVSYLLHQPAHPVSSRSTLRHRPTACAAPLCLRLRKEVDDGIRAAGRAGPLRSLSPSTSPVTPSPARASVPCPVQAASRHGRADICLPRSSAVCLTPAPRPRLSSRDHDPWRPCPRASDASPSCLALTLRDSASSSLSSGPSPASRARRRRLTAS
jgi:hypothetical protein